MTGFQSSRTSKKPFKTKGFLGITYIKADRIEQTFNQGVVRSNRTWVTRKNPLDTVFLEGFLFFMQKEGEDFDDNLTTDYSSDDRNVVSLFISAVCFFSDKCV